jgi:hypothetical protein
MSFCADHDEGAGRFPCGPGYIGKGEISDQAGAGQVSGVSPLPHHAPQATPAKFIGVRSCARYEIGRGDAGQGLQDQQHLIDRLVATPGGVSQIWLARASIRAAA